ncbi:uncharacterized protein VTP21DRAFT_6858 [Calcarisporiella thermophila]|uniref:uncharacterized protein n=1 Tax=Calcarisporiella thermophila TaxID=911321 RepID=UPI0037430AC7
MASLPPQTSIPAFFPPDFYAEAKDRLRKQYVGKRLVDIRSPALVVNRAIVERNARRFEQISERLGVKMRVHVKTHKTIEATEIQLSEKCDSIIVSTMAEADFLINSHLVSTKRLRDVLLGLPISPDKLQEAALLAKKVPVFNLMIDNLEALEAVESFCVQWGQDKGEELKFHAFLKIECGNQRAGVPPNYAPTLELAQRLQASPHVHLTGIYSHAGHSYGGRDPGSTQDFLHQERDAALEFKQYLEKNGVKVGEISIGATPTAMAASLESVEGLGGITELHAGNYIFFDRQQIATGLVAPEDCAATVLCRVLSHYPLRSQILVDAGALAFSRDAAPQGGFGTVLGHETWEFAKTSQEHGIMTVPVEEFSKLPIGTALHVIPNHACLTAACFPFYIVVSDSGNSALDQLVVEDVWVPCKFW